MEQIKGAKYDEGKPRPSLVPVEAIEAIMQVREFGKAKYADAEDWRKVPREKWLDALLRHVLHIWDNPLAIDDESGLPSIWHVITNTAFLCAAYKKELQAEIIQIDSKRRYICISDVKGPGPDSPGPEGTDWTKFQMKRMILEEIEYMRRDLYMQEEQLKVLRVKLYKHLKEAKQCGDASGRGND